KKTTGKNKTTGKKKTTGNNKIAEKNKNTENNIITEKKKRIEKIEKEEKSKKNVREKEVNRLSNSKTEKEMCKLNKRKVNKKNPSDGSCPVAKKCGGCHFQGLSYEKQLEKKQKKVEDFLKEYCNVMPIIKMDHPYHYRNKVNAAFGRLRNGTIISGVYEEGTHRIVPIDSCQIENKKADDIIYTIRNLLKSFKIKTYDEDSGYGLLRHVMVRVGHKSGEIMVVLVLGSPILPSKNNFVKALREAHPEITTVVVNVNNKNTSMVLGDKETTIYGKGYIEDTLCDCVFRISPKSFYQINSVQTEVLYSKAIELAKLTGKERIIDAYCGIGTIGMIASKRAKEVIGIELNRDAVKDAVINAKRNEIDNISFYQSDAGRFITQMAQEGEKIDIVFMDPPRSGSDEPFLESLVKLAPKKIVYISCNPETQARDLQYLTKKGYVAKGAYPVDMFPFTGHVETVCLLTR
ncbi:MAG: 23S rRNA (uracil(1939)-C(5))-methyltransferase RlmD, partial [Acetivibrio sp.]